MARPGRPPCRRAATLGAAGFGLLAACTGGTGTSGEPADAPLPAEAAAGALWSLAEAAPALRAASCPEEAAHTRMAPLDVEAERLDIEAVLGGKALGSGAELTGAWRLSSPSSLFGGLSGLERTRGGNLLAVSDGGSLVTLAMEGGAPTGVAYEMELRGADGQSFQGKGQRDSEGLAFDLESGLLFVSFERAPRVLAYDMEACGAAARGVAVARLSDRVDGRRVKPNNQAEALSLGADGTLHVGFEESRGGVALTGPVLAAGGAALSGAEGIAVPDGHGFVGEDRHEGADGAGLVARLFRAYDPVRGNRLLLTLGAEGGAPAAVSLARPMRVDNFEGVVIAPPEADGRVPVWIVSDDNFSDSQSTLLYRILFPAPATLG